MPTKPKSKAKPKPKPKPAKTEPVPVPVVVRCGPRVRKPGALVPRVWVDCLGPGAVKRPHRFRSADPRGERVCTDCRYRQEKLALSPRMATPYCVRTDGVSL